MHPNLDASFYVEEPPEIEYRQGMFHVVQTIGSYRFERVMRPHVFMLFVRRAAEAARLHRMGGAAVIAFPASEEDAPVSHG